MRQTTKLKLIGCTLIGAFVFTGTAMAAEWNSAPLAVQGSEQLFADTGGDTALTFICVNGKLRAAVATQGEEAADILKSHNETRRRVQRNVVMKMDGKKVSDSTWMINPKKKIYVTPSKSEAAKLYNAAVSQKPVSLKRSGKDEITLSLPAPNGSFAEFGGACGVGSNAKKQS